MSYILDALRKADAERERGHVPGIHAQPSFGAPAPTSARAATSPLPWLIAGGLAVVLAGAAVWLAFGSSRTVVEAPAPVAIVAAPATAPATALTPVPLPSPPAAPAATTAPVPAAPVVAPKPAAPAPRSEEQRPAAPLAPVARLPKAAPVAAPASAAAPSDGKATTGTGEKVYAIAELPDDIRRQLPALSIGGSMYSPKPADRLLIVNGQVLREGERISPDLQLVQIRVKAAVLSFKNHRYVVAF